MKSSFTRTSSLCLLENRGWIPTDLRGRFRCEKSARRGQTGLLVGKCRTLQNVSCSLILVCPLDLGIFIAQQQQKVDEILTLTRIVQSTSQPEYNK